MKYSIPRLVGVISGSFCGEDRDAHPDGLPTFLPTSLHTLAETER